MKGTHKLAYDIQWQVAMTTTNTLTLCEGHINRCILG